MSAYSAPSAVPSPPKVASQTMGAPDPRNAESANPPPIATQRIVMTIATLEASFAGRPSFSAASADRSFIAVIVRLTIQKSSHRNGLDIAFTLTTHFAIDIALGVFLGQCLTLVAFGAALGKRKFNFGATIFEIQTERDERQAFLTNSGREAGDLTAIEQ